MRCKELKIKVEMPSSIVEKMREDVLICPMVEGEIKALLRQG
jgi:hypothetical protein